MSQGRKPLDCQPDFSLRRIPSFQETNWRRIVELYDLLIALVPNPVHHLNRAVAYARLHDPPAGLLELENLRTGPITDDYYLWHAVVGELNRQAGNRTDAKLSLIKAIHHCPSDAEKVLLRKRLALCEGDSET